MKKLWLAPATLVLLAMLDVQLLPLLAQGTAFTYQGRLSDGGNPAGGVYDLRFTIYDSTNSPGIVIAGPITNAALIVSNGLFTTSLDFGAAVFDGSPRWLELGVRTNGGAGFVSLVPRQGISPAPYAMYAAGANAAGLSGTVPTATLAGVYGSAVAFTNAANSFSGNGTGVTNVNAMSLGGLSAGSFWNLAGNAGAAPGSHFLGTLDNLPLELKVNGARALRLEPNLNGPNVIGGSAANEVTNGNYGAVIAGGGSSSYPNRVGAIFGTVVGGAGNTASGNFGTAMGQFNTASGYAGTAMGYSTVAAGLGSQAGGTTARANHDGTFVWADSTFVDFASTAANQFLIRSAGGVGINTNNPGGAALAVNGNISVNNALGTPGDQPLELRANNVRALRLEPNSSGAPNVIGGSPVNLVAQGVVGATIGGGGAASYGGGAAYSNSVTGDFGIVVGGLQNASTGSAATIGGGEFNLSSGFVSTVSGGGYNVSSGTFATVGGGDHNTNDGEYSTIGGGNLNLITNTYATVAGGAFNLGGGYSSTVSGGSENISSGGGAVVGGGDNNLSSGTFATIPGGDFNIAAGNYSFAAGFRAQANHPGSFVWADAIFADFPSTAANQFLVRASGGMGINKNNPAATLDVNGTARIQGGNNWDVNNTEGDFRVGNDSYRFKVGVASGGGGAGDVWMRAHGGTMRLFVKAPGGTTLYSNEAQTSGVGLAAGGGSWSNLSDRNAKENFSPVDAPEILERVLSLPLNTWNYKSQDKAIRHLGPMAQDFAAAFELGEDAKHITTVDADGVALAAIQGLNQKLVAKDRELQEVKQQNASLAKRLSELETAVAQLVEKR